MKNKFIRVLSPFTLAIVLLFDVGAVYFGVLAIENIIQQRSRINIAFLAIMLFVIVVAVLVSKSIMSAGVRFYDDRLEFTAIDNDNVFQYSSIQSIETKRDDKASLTKNFDDRHSYIVLKLTQDRIATIDLGLTTKKTLQNIEKQINDRIAKNS